MQMKNSNAENLPQRRLKKRKMLALAAVLLLALIVSGLLWRERQNRSVQRVQFVMDTVVEYRLFGSKAEQGIQQGMLLLQQLENRLSAHRETGDIAAVNQNSGVRPVEVEEDTAALLIRCREVADRFPGAFDITLGPVISLWGIGGDNPRVPDQTEIQAALAQTGMELLEQEGSLVYLTRSGAALDLGAAAKGWAADALRQLFADLGITKGYCSIGGNLVVLNSPDLRFGIRDPLGGPEDFLGIIRLPGKTIATTGGYERYFEQDGVVYCHVMDPETGVPAESDWLSVSVVSEDGFLADALSTALFVAGRETALSLLEEEAFSLILVDREQKVYLSPGLELALSDYGVAMGYRFV